MYSRQYEILLGLIHVINKNISIPVGLYKKNKITRLLQQIFGLYTVLTTLFSGRNKILLKGKMIYDNGKTLIICQRSVIYHAMEAFLSREPFLLVHFEDSNNKLLDMFNMLDEPAHRLYSITHVMIYKSKMDGRGVIMHISTSPIGMKAVAGHKEGLRKISELGEKSIKLKSLAPENLHSYEGDEYSYLVQTEINGQKINLRDMSEADMGRYIESAFLPLIHIYNISASKNDYGPEHTLIFDKYPGMVNNHSDIADSFLPLLKLLQEWNGRKNLPCVLTHSDYKFGNILFNSNGDVVGIVDWEVCRENGMPGYDALNLVLHAYAYYLNDSIDNILRKVWSRELDGFRITYFFEKIKNDFNLRDIDIKYIVLLVFFEQLHWNVQNPDLLIDKRDSIKSVASVAYRSIFN